MPPRRLPYREVRRRLLAAGFEVVRQRGSHVKCGKRTPDGYRTVIVPRHDEIAVGTLRSVLRQARMDWEQFDAL